MKKREDLITSANSGLTIKYFTNATNFVEIAELLRTVDTLPDRITKSYLKQLGFTDPADGLILNFFKDLKLLDDDNTPTALLENFRDPTTSKEAMAVGILEAYGDLFDKEPAIYRQSKEKIIKLLETSLEEDKSSIIINYMANTFRVLVKYVGHNTLEKVLEKREFKIASKNGTQESEVGKEIKEERISDANKEIPAVVEESNSISNNGVDSKLKKSSTTVDKTDIDQTKSKKDNEVQKSPPKNLNTEKPIPAEVENTEEKSSEKQIIDYVNKAYVKKADLLYRLKRYEEALPALDKVYQRFADSNDNKLYEFASVALYKKMKTAEKLELGDYLMQIYPAIIDRLGSNENSAFIAAVNHAYIKLIEIHTANEQIDEALEIIYQAIERFKDLKPDSGLLAKMMYTKAELHEQSEDNEKAIEAYDDLLKIFD